MRPQRKAFPYYPFFVDDFEEGVISMTIAEVGLYILALGYSWKHGSIPDDPGEVARLIRRNQSEVKKAWPSVRKKWTEAEPGKLVNARQEIERAEALKKSKNGKHAAYVRYANAHANAHADVGADADANALPRASESESDSESVEKKEDGVFSQITPRSIAEKLWDIHPSPAKLGFVEAAVFNELQKTVMTPERFRDAIVQSLREWAEYWSESNRMATGLDNWVASGDYAVKPPPVQEKRNRKSVMDGV